MTAAMYMRPLHRVVARVIVDAALGSGNSTEVQYSWKTPIEKVNPKASVSV